MLMRPFARKLKRRFIRANDGAAAIEFALILPVMIVLFFGVVESSLALLCRADVSIMASTAADLISQESSTSTADLTNVYAASGTILYPYYTGGSTGKPTIRLTSVAYDSTSGTPTTAGKIAWTCTQAGSGTLSPATRANNDVVTFTQPLMTTNGSVIMAEVAYSYASPTTQVVTGAINMTNNFYTKPRRVLQIATPTGGCPP
jgi:Flp pilus assembly protein TadG